MLSNTQKLISLGSPALCPVSASSSTLADVWGRGCGAQLGALLTIKNGFYAFEGALHVLPSASSPQSIGLVEWNHPSLWRGAFPDMPSTSICFAQDIFGVQFCIDEYGVATFDPETGGIERICENIEQWAGLILSDCALWTGHPLAHEWQQQHGKLPNGMRLVPIIPFVLGGPFEVSNLHVLEAATSQRMRGEIAAQLKGLPDGTRVRLVTE
jgi:hypothetical protein